MRSDFIYATVSNISSVLEVPPTTTPLRSSRTRQLPQQALLRQRSDCNQRRRLHTHPRLLLYTLGGESHKRLSAAKWTVTRVLFPHCMDVILVNINVNSLAFVKCIQLVRLRFPLARLLQESFCRSSSRPLFSSRRAQTTSCPLRRQLHSLRLLDERGRQYHTYSPRLASYC